MEWYSLALISALFSAIAAILEKKILFKEKAIEFTLVLAVFNALLASIFLFFADFSSLSYQSMLILFIKSSLNAIAFLFVMYAIKNLELSQALPFLVLTPGIVAVFAFFLFGETLSYLNILGLILLTLGIYALNLSEKQNILSPFKALVKTKGYRFVFIALALFTITSLLDRFLLTKQNFSPPAFMAFQHFFFALIFFAIFMIIRKDKLIILKTIKYSGFLIAVLAVITIVYRYTEILSIKGTPATALTLILKRLSVFFAVIIGGKLFNEHNLLRKSIATAILIAGAVLVVS